jgi:hypothetical protein
MVTVDLSGLKLRRAASPLGAGSPCSDGVSMANQQHVAILYRLIFGGG